MSRAQYIALNLAGGICAVLIACDVVLVHLNSQLNRTVSDTQVEFNKAQQLQNTAQNLIVRMADSARSDAALADLLARHKFQVTPHTNSPAKSTP